MNNYNRKSALFTAVTVDADNQMIDQISSKNIQCLQLHGSETNERIEEIKNRSKLKIIKTIQVKNEDDIIKYKKYINADYILFDTPSMEKSIEFPSNLIQKLYEAFSITFYKASQTFLKFSIFITFISSNSNLPAND